MTWIQRLLPIETKARQWAPIAFIVLNVALMAMVIVQHRPPYPTGWDSPYYMSRVRYLEQAGVLTNRVGFIALMTTVHQASGVSLVTLQWIATYAIMLLIALSTAVLAAGVSGRRTTVFLLTFFFTFWSTSYFAMAVTTFDNALAIAFIFLTLALLSRTNGSWRSAAGIGLPMLVVALTHFESFAFLLFALVLYVGMMVIRDRAVGDTWRRLRPIMIVTAGICLLAVLQWRDVLGHIFTSYSATADTTANASIPYAAGQSLADVVPYLSTGISTQLQIILAILGLVFVVAMAFRRRSNEALGVLAYIITAYTVLVFSVVRASIPINRSTPLLPATLLIGLGLSALLSWLVARHGRALAMFVTIGLIVLLYPIASFRAYADRFPVSISSASYAGYQELQSFLADQPQTNYILAVNIRADEAAASAFYGLWRNWATAMLPLPTTNPGFCIGFGALSDVLQRRSTTRVNAQEYNDTNEASLDCIRKLATDTPVYMIEGLQPGAWPPTSQRWRLTPIGQHVQRVEWLGAPSGSGQRP